VGQDALLVTALVVRETELTLYGFADADERDVFETLQSASGVGPRLAQAVLGVHSPDGVRRAVAAEDLTALTKVPGIGRKGAQRIILDLKDRLGAPASVPARDPITGTDPDGTDPDGTDPDAAVTADSAADGAGDQVRLALLGLGYTTREAEEALAAVHPDRHPRGDGAGDDRPPEAVGVLLRRALAVLRPR
jgi:Holliday junction DNA helicase RuvA